MSQTSLITEAARLALVDLVAQLTTDIDTHINGDISQHDAHVLLDTPFVSAGGDVLSTKTLKIGVAYDNGLYAYIFLPAIV